MVSDVINHAYTMETPKMGSESFHVGEHIEVLGELPTQRGHGSSHPHPTPCPVPLFHLAFPDFVAFVTNW